MADVKIHQNICAWDEGGQVVITITIQAADPDDFRYARKLADEMIDHQADLATMIEQHEEIEEDDGKNYPA